MKCILGTMEGLYVSLEMIAVIITGASLLVTLVGGMFAGFAWVLRRMDERFDRMHHKFDTMEERICGIQTELSKV